MKKTFLTLLILTAVIDGCKKYEDGPLISLRSAYARIQNTFTLTQYTVNGVDSLSLYNDSLYNVFIFEWNEMDDVYDCRLYGPRKDGKLSVVYWYWELSDKNKILDVTFSGGDCSAGTGPFGSLKKPKWQILRLTNKELKMKTDFNGKVYFVDLKR